MQALEQRVNQWGRDWLPDYPDAIAWLFLRGLALIYLAAFWSMAVQIEGLLGSGGILPAADFLNQISQVAGIEKYWQLPTVFWLNASDGALLAECYVGIAAALLLLFDRWRLAAMVVCYLAYLSIVGVGQIFTGYQWDALLLEMGFLAMFLPGRSRWTIFLFRLLIARFMLMGGVVKIASGDPTWANLTALEYHYESEPLPSPLAYYAYFLPGWFQMACVAAVLVIELVVPFFVFLPRPFRLFAAFSFILLQTTVILTGNFAFFNLEAILLCLFLFEDRDIQWFFRRLTATKVSHHYKQASPQEPGVVEPLSPTPLPSGERGFLLPSPVLGESEARGAKPAGGAGLRLNLMAVARWLESFRHAREEATPLASRTTGAWAMIVVLTLAAQSWVGIMHRYPGQPWLGLIRTTAAFSLVNPYGPFAVMTTKRLAVMVEGSDDGQHWQEYGFKYQPDALDKPLRWNIPHQPRLDWQLWFLALREPFYPLPWFEQFAARLKSGSPAVLGLLAHNPFPDHPPRSIRAVIYLYRYAPPEERARTGQAWQREAVETFPMD